MNKMRPLTHNRGSAGTLHTNGSSQREGHHSTLLTRASSAPMAKQYVCVCACVQCSHAVLLPASIIKPKTQASMGPELAAMGAFLSDGGVEREKSIYMLMDSSSTPSASSLVTLPTSLQKALGGQAGHHVYTINKHQ